MLAFHPFSKFQNREYALFDNIRVHPFLVRLHREAANPNQRWVDRQIAAQRFHRMILQDQNAIVRIEHRLYRPVLATAFPATSQNIQQFIILPVLCHHPQRTQLREFIKTSPPSRLLIEYRVRFRHDCFSWSDVFYIRFIVPLEGSHGNILLNKNKRLYRILRMPMSGREAWGRKAAKTGNIDVSSIETADF